MKNLNENLDMTSFKWCPFLAYILLLSQLSCRTLFLKYYFVWKQLPSTEFMVSSLLVKGICFCALLTWGILKEKVTNTVVKGSCRPSIVWDDNRHITIIWSLETFPWNNQWRHWLYTVAPSCWNRMSLSVRCFLLRS